MDTETKFERAGRIFREDPPSDLKAAKEELDKVEPNDAEPTDEEVRVPTRYALEGERGIDVWLPGPTLVHGGHTMVDGVRIGEVTKVVIEASVGEVTKMTITVLGLTAQVKALGLVEIIDRDFVVDE